MVALPTRDNAHLRISGQDGTQSRYWQADPTHYRIPTPTQAFLRAAPAALTYRRGQVVLLGRACPRQHACKAGQDTNTASRNGTAKAGRGCSDGHAATTALKNQGPGLEFGSRVCGVTSASACRGVSMYCARPACSSHPRWAAVLFKCVSNLVYVACGDGYESCPSICQYMHVTWAFGCLV